MWETAFDLSMLEHNVIILCQSEQLAEELMVVLGENGVKWRGGEPPTDDSRWDEHCEGTCYWVESRRLSYGSKDFADEDPDEEYENHIKCTFYGETEDFEPASNGELMAFLGL